MEKEVTAHDESLVKGERREINQRALSGLELL